jgi:hypothetical protein
LVDLHKQVVQQKQYSFTPSTELVWHCHLLNYISPPRLRS